MPPSTGTRQQMAIAKYERTKRRDTNYSGSSTISKPLANIASTLLEENKLEEHKPKESILTMARSMLLLPIEFLTSQFFQEPAYQITLLKDALELFGCEVLKDKMLQQLELTTTEKKICLLWRLLRSLTFAIFF